MPLYYAVEVRLIGGNATSEGRVEIFHEDVWGTVCDDLWDINDARVVCRQLGYSDAEEAILEAEFGAGSGRIWLDEVECSGNETFLANCSFPEWGTADCFHSHDSGVKCNGMNFFIY